MIRIRRKLLMFVVVIFITMMISFKPQMISLAVYSVEDDSNLTTPSGWYTSTDVNAIQGSVKYTYTVGASLSWTFTGSQVAYLYSMAYNRGSAKVTIDGRIVDILDAYEPHIIRQVGKVYTLSSDGSHTITITNNNAGINNRIVIDLDAFISDIVSFLPGTYNDDASRWIGQVHYWPLGTFGNNWTTVSDGNAYQGEYKITDSTGAGFRINFEGDSIYWYFPLRNDLGKIAISIDGENWTERDPYADQTGYYSISRLGTGPHILTVTNLGETTSGGTVLALDKFVVGNSYYNYNRVTATAYADAWAHSRNLIWFYDYSPDDCNNFSSQMQYMGGMARKPSPDVGLDPNNLHQWFSYREYGEGTSSTWIYIPSFYTYYHYSENLSTYSEITNVDLLRRGDMIIIDWTGDGSLDHTKEVTGRGYMSPYLLDYNNSGDLNTYSSVHGIWTDGHTNDRWHVPWDYNFDTSHLYRFVKITP